MAEDPLGRIGHSLNWSVIDSEDGDDTGMCDGINFGDEDNGRPGTGGRHMSGAEIIRWRPPDPTKRKPGAGGTGSRKSDRTGKLINAENRTNTRHRSSVPRVTVARYAGRLFITMLIMPDSTSELMGPFADRFAADRQALKLTRAFARCGP